MDKKTVIETIHKIEKVINDAGGYAKVDHNFDKAFSEFIGAVNPKYPTDTVDFIDMLNVAFTNGMLPRKSEITILEDLLRKADFYHGDLRWKYKHPTLTAQFSPKHGEAYYEIKFTPYKSTTSMYLSSIPLSFPLLIELSVYEYLDTDEDGDECDDAEPQLTREHGQMFHELEKLTNGKLNYSKISEWLYAAHYDELKKG